MSKYDFYFQSKSAIFVIGKRNIIKPNPYCKRADSIIFREVKATVVWLPFLISKKCYFFRYFEYNLKKNTAFINKL